MTTRPAYLAVLFAFVVFALPAAAFAQAGSTRLALVIGNQNYKDLPALKNARADADAMKGALTDVGFDVQLIADAEKAGMERALIEFRNKITADSVVLVYYAGHGLQASEENYLVPTDAKVTDALDLPLVALSANQILSQFENTEAGSIIFILDACRDNPFLDKGGKTRSIGNKDSMSRGLARIASKHTGTLIAFSTSPGDVAQDGTGKNSPYTQALTAALRTPGKSIEAIFKETRAKVVETTEGKQIPWENSSLVSDVVLIPEEGGPKVVEASPCDLAAAHPSDPDRVGPSVEYANLDTQVAIPACEAAVKGDPENMRFKTLLARSLDKAGRGDEAYKLNEVAMAAGSLAAYHNMGNLYRKGLGVKKDFAKAFELYQYAAERGHPEDQNNVGYMYFQGQGVKQDYAKARVWLEKAANQNWGASYDKLGLIYLKGLGAKKDMERATDYFQKGSDLGDRSAMVNLANLYKSGTGVKQDLKKAFDTYSRAARLGAVAAYVNLGNLFAQGQGVEKDPVEAAFWFTLASREGHEEAMERLREALSKLSDEEKETVKQRLEDWARSRFG
ncbi:caspase family protein [Shinella zoogloeoides]|uniref:caspase family protein n=1 Tax=Shinella zoogloeoides TaxID=352475 RepID=UPI00273F4F8B|nr:caspase family protein [Shinella zoogloeoides]WLR95010.1 caspase family protein [Shinella zoogloeoides]